MKVTGISFIRNGIKFDYPIVEAIKSILPLCNDFVAAVGNSDDGTHDLIASIDPNKITVMDTIWDDSLREGGKVLADETNKALQAVPDDSDWIFYIQGDEVVHEKYHPAIREAMLKWKDRSSIDGLLFKYLHFYGSYDYVGSSPIWYSHEIRVVKNDKSIYSFRDAQGFRKGNNKKLRVKPVDAYMYHYGWVKEPNTMQKKRESFSRLYHDDEWIAKNVAKADEFDYSKIDSLKPFEGTHPKVMEERLKRKNWKFDYDISYNKLSLKNRFKNFMRNNFGIWIGYKNYKLQ